MATLLYHWKLDEGGGQYATDKVSSVKAKLYDSSPGDRGVTWAASGYDGGGLQGDGAAGYDTGALVQGVSLSAPPNNFSLSLWFKTSTSQNKGLLSLNASAYETNNANSMAIQFRNKQVEFESIVSNGTYAALRAPVGVYQDNGKWHFVCVTSSTTGPVTKFYLDDCTVVDEMDKDPWQGMTAATFLWTIGGCGCFSIRPGGAFNGTIDDVRIYDGVLTAAEICDVIEDFVPPVANAIMFSCNT